MGTQCYLPICQSWNCIISVFHDFVHLWKIQALLLKSQVFGKRCLIVLCCLILQFENQKRRFCMGGWDNGLWQHAAGMSVFLVWFSCLSDLYVCTSDHCLSALSLCLALFLWPVLMLLFDIANSRLFFSQQPRWTPSFSLIGSRADPDRTLLSGTQPY